MPNEFASQQPPVDAKAPKVVGVRLEPDQLAVLEAEARRRVDAGLSETVDLADVVRDMVAYWMRTEGR
jgi:hypothetical protein